MWYFAWILGLGLALSVGVINVMWLESRFMFDSNKEKDMHSGFDELRDR